MVIHIGKFLRLLKNREYFPLFWCSILGNGILDRRGICDDFACGCPIPDFADYISVVRAAGISFSLLIQSQSQLETLYGPYKAQTIRNNCDRMVYLGGLDFPTCQDIAVRANVPLEKVLNMPLGRKIDLLTIEARWIICYNYYGCYHNGRRLSLLFGGLTLRS